MFWKKFLKAGAEPVEPDPAEVAATQRALQRLGRVVERQQEDALESTPDANATAQVLRKMAGANAFFLLGVPMDASVQAIHMAVDDLAFAEDVDPAKLDDARAQLLAPRDRLIHELAWLPGASATREAQVRQAIASGDLAQLEQVRLAVDGLARLNLGVLLLAADAPYPYLARSVLEGGSAFSGSAARDWVDEARLRAGFRECDPEHFAQALQTRQREISAVMAERLSASREGRSLLVECFGDHATAIRDARAPLLEEVARQYNLLAAPKLQHVRNQISQHVASLRAAPDSPGSVAAILTGLDLWTQWRMPMQKLELARGLDDPASADLLHEIRELTIHLANAHERQDDALLLVRALVHCFAAVPTLHAKVQEDLNVVIGNVLLNRFNAIGLRVVSQARRFAQEVEAHGLDAQAGGLAGALVTAFEELVTHVGPAERHSWLLMHELAVALYNKLHQQVAGVRILQWMIRQTPPQDLAEQILEELRKLNISSTGDARPLRK